MMQELRRESQKHRDMTTANQREIAKLRRKERHAVEATKRLERSNVIQRAILKRRNEEVIKSQNKLKSVLSLLKRSATPNRIFKTITSGMASPSQTRLQSRQEDRGRKGFTGAALNQIIDSVSSSTRMNIPETLHDMDASIEIRVQFKKQMVDKELDGCVLCRRTQKKLNELGELRNKLVGEQRELISERQRVVKANFEATQKYDVESPQYMDERVQAIDLEIAEIDDKMLHLEDILKRKSGRMDEMAVKSEAQSQNIVQDLNWDNAVGILKSLDRIELEAALSFFLEDLLCLRVEKEDKICKEQERENVISNLKRMVEVLRTAMLTYQQEEPQRFQKYFEQQEELRKNFQREDDQNRIQFLERPKSSNSILRQPSPHRALPVLDYASFKKTAQEITFEKEIIDEISKGSADLISNPLDGRHSPLRKISMMKKMGDGEDDRRKLNMGGSDVFQRLANAHTLASQAKVISRSSLDNDAENDGC